MIKEANNKRLLSYSAIKETKKKNLLVGSLRQHDSGLNKEVGQEAITLLTFHGRKLNSLQAKAFATFCQPYKIITLLHTNILIFPYQSVYL